MSYTYNCRNKYQKKSSGHSIPEDLEDRYARQAKKGAVPTGHSIRCGTVSSSRLHNPDERRMNRMETRARILLLRRRAEKAEADRQARLTALGLPDDANKGEVQEFKRTTRNTKQSVVKRIWDRLNKPLW